MRWGHSLGAARCPSIGIDPAFNINTEVHTEVHLFRTTSDEYFARADPLAPVQGEPFDLAFIDGMHLFEFALRDFINAERFSRPGGVIVFDDVLPRNADESARVRITSAWTGDVFRSSRCWPATARRSGHPARHHSHRTLGADGPRPDEHGAR